MTWRVLESETCDLRPESRSLDSRNERARLMTRCDGKNAADRQGFSESTLGFFLSRRLQQAIEPSGSIAESPHLFLLELGAARAFFLRYAG